MEDPMYISEPDIQEIKTFTYFWDSQLNELEQLLLVYKTTANSLAIRILQKLGGDQDLLVLSQNINFPRPLLSFCFHRSF